MYNRKCRWRIIVSYSKKLNNHFVFYSQEALMCGGSSVGGGGPDSIPGSSRTLCASPGPDDKFWVPHNLQRQSSVCPYPSEPDTSPGYYWTIFSLSPKSVIFHSLLWSHTFMLIDVNAGPMHVDYFCKIDFYDISVLRFYVSDVPKYSKSMFCFHENKKKKHFFNQLLSY